MKKFKTINEIWSLIPARSGSKTIKNKNLKKILNLSLIAHAIKVSKKSNLISRTFLSTDSKKIKNEALKFNAETPFLRSKKNSGSSSTDYEVVFEFLNKMIKNEKTISKYILYLRPTTPLRNPKILDKAIQKFKKIKNYDSLVSVHKMTEPVHKKFFIKNNKLSSVFPKLSIEDANLPRQNFPDSYTGNGYLDIIKTENIFNKKYLGKRCFPFIVSKTIDIDDQSDLDFARHTAKYLFKLF